MTARFTGRTVLITGGGGGIGRAAALAFAREGAAVAVAGRNADNLAQVVKLIEAEGGTASAVTADVTDSADAARMVAATAERHGRLDIAFNNAGTTGPFGPLADLGEDDWAAVLDVNLTGVFLSMKHEIAHMRAQGGGVIVNTASNLGVHQRLSGLNAYAAAKAAVAVLTRGAAREYIGEGIRINSVSPGPTGTPMTYQPGESRAELDARLGAGVALGRVADPEEIVSAVLWLASDEASFAVGQDHVIDGGATA
ncbi:SDR family NAD(P)-dependent oxidoreductase [Spirillospora sp. NPDC127200]